MYGQGPRARSTRSSRCDRMVHSTSCRHGRQSVRCRSLSRSSRLRDPEVRRELIAAGGAMQPKDNNCRAAAPLQPTAQAGLRQPLSSSRASIGTTLASGTAACVRTGIRSKSSSTVDSENEEHVYMQPIVNEGPRSADLLKHPRRSRPSRTRAPMSARKWGRRCRRTSCPAGCTSSNSPLKKRCASSATTTRRRWNWPIAGSSGAAKGRPVVFEEATVRPQLPTVETDLPGGARRLVQKAEGIPATIVNGVVAIEIWQGDRRPGAQSRLAAWGAATPQVRHPRA